ncbi:MAG TPA: DinB family protein [Pyrinomonadaceae bacterium]|jgi:hypothetical protein|nr:DinB family protein [Pyrinomonadaceae bacterium]
MIRPLPWFERTFAFNLPLKMYPNIIERLRGTPARMEDRLNSLPKEILTRRDGDNWSIQEHAGHLLDLGSLDLSRLDDYASGKERLRPADLDNRRTYEANHNADAIKNILRAFRAERAEFVRRLEEVEEAFVERTALHVRLNMQMRVVDFAFFISEHDDHHLARMTELIQRFMH